ncbi:MAG: hypothetical protein QNJ72_07800 [Pleurocapsa sp. MO_226.B13]|nr:hypothetical protein [Pleurocapsa sp. MO_226.B13]
MERIETGAMIDSLTHLESYYQSKYEYYLAMATEAKENKERVGLLLLDLGRDVSYPDNLVESNSIDRQQKLRAASHRSLDSERVIQELPQAEPFSPDSSVIDEDRKAPASLEQMKRWTLDLAKAMSVIESVSNLDSGKTLHQNYLHHLLDRELEQKLSVELVELYLEEATRRGYLEPDEFNNNCYIAKPNAVSPFEDKRPPVRLDEQNENIAKASTQRLSGRKSKGAWSEVSSDPCVARNKPYGLPPSDKLKPTLYETVEGYIRKNRPKRFSIDDVVNYLYPQPVQSDWNQVQRNKVRTSISNVLGRKGYLGKYWSRIKPGVYRPRV